MLPLTGSSSKEISFREVAVSLTILRFLISLVETPASRLLSSLTVFKSLEKFLKELKLVNCLLMHLWGDNKTVCDVFSL